MLQFSVGVGEVGATNFSYSYTSGTRSEDCYLYCLHEIVVWLMRNEKH